MEDTLTSQETKTWSHNETLTMLDLYKKYRNKVGSLQIRNLKKLWALIVVELNKIHNTNFSPANVENRWRVLERNYKKIVDNNNKTGRGRRCFEFAKEMEDILGKKRNIHPELLLSTDTIHVAHLETPHIPQSAQSSIVEQLVIQVPTTSSLPESLDSNQQTPKLPVTASTSSSSTRRHRSQSRNCTLQLIRQDKNACYKEMLAIHKEKLEIEKQKLEEIKNNNKIKNQLIKERNEILKMCLDKNLKLPYDNL